MISAVIGFEKVYNNRLRIPPMEQAMNTWAALIGFRAY